MKIYVNAQQGNFGINYFFNNAFSFIVWMIFKGCVLLKNWKLTIEKD